MLPARLVSLLPVAAAFVVVVGAVHGALREERVSVALALPLAILAALYVRAGRGRRA